MNKKKLGIISSVIAATTLVLFFTLSGVITTSSQPQKSVGLSPPDVAILNVIPNTPVSSEDAASAAIGQTVKFPTYLPSGYKIQVSNVDKQIQSTIILASPQDVTSQTTRNQFLYQQKGIDIYMEPVTSAFDEIKWKDLWTHQNSGSVITINGLDGVMHDMRQVQQDGETISQPAEIIVFKHGLMISITAMLSSDELIKVAATL